MDPLTAANRLADAAYEAWHRHKHEPGLHDEVGMGADGTPTSRIDLLLEGPLLEEAADLGLSVLSEEAGYIDHGSDLVAVVDPLDGSRNAGRGIPLHCTSIAIGRGDLLGVEAGVVRSLVTGERYEARAGKGATVDGRPVRAPPFDPDDVMVAVIADSSVDEVKQEQQRMGHHLRDLGSAALELAFVGIGALDAFLVRQPWLRVVDIAAGTLFVRETGGRVVDPATGSDLATPFDVTVRTGIIAARCPEAWDAVGAQEAMP